MKIDLCKIGDARFFVVMKMIWMSCSSIIRSKKRKHLNSKITFIPSKNRV